MPTDDKARTFIRLPLCAAGLAVAAGLLTAWMGAAQESRQAMELAAPGAQSEVRIGVLGLFRPQQLRLIADSELELSIDGQMRRLAKGEGATVRLRGGRLEVQLGADSSAIRVVALRAFAGTIGSATNAPRFWLEVSGKLKRLYAGSLEIRTRSRVPGPALEAVVTMPIETAVASVVAAESPPGAALEALKAQAVAARSFLVARQSGHADFDFCDTTHCQFLRSPPEPGSLADEATLSTRGLVLSWHDDSAAKNRTVAAMYARSCGGRTRTLREAGLPSEGYPYYAVRCIYCSRHPEVWQRPGKGAPRTEQERLSFNRIHGWGAVQSLPAVAADGEIHGRGVGHGIGLCQLGAAEMARQGASFAQILAHYYPNTKIAPMVEP